MHTRLLFFLLSFTLISFRATSQAYEPGFLVRSNGDTLKGEIENGFWTEPPTSIRFRRTPESPSESFIPRQLRYVGFTAGRAFRYEGLPIDHAARAKVGNLPYENRPNIHVDSLLAEVLIDGKVSLVRVALFDRPVHYVLLSAKRPPLDLSERKYLRQTVDKAWLLTDGNNYRGQLGVYFSDCPAAYNAAQKAPFTEQSLIAVVQAYNTVCAQKPGRNLLKLAAPRRRLALQGGVLAGARYNRIESSSLLFDGACVDCQVRPFAGLYADLFQPGRALAVYGELTLSKFQSKGAQLSGYNASGREVFNTFDYQAWLGTARLGMRYFAALPHEQQFIIGVGYELNFVLRPQVTATSGPIKAPGSDDFYYATPTLLPNVGLGWRCQRLTLGLDGQLYASSDLVTGNASNLANSNLSRASNFTGGLFFGTNFAARFSVGYRLGRNPDAAKPTHSVGH